MPAPRGAVPLDGQPVARVRPRLRLLLRARYPHVPRPRHRPRLRHARSSSRPTPPRCSARARPAVVGARARWRWVPTPTRTSGPRAATGSCRAHPGTGRSGTPFSILTKGRCCGVTCRCWSRPSRDVSVGARGLARDPDPTLHAPSSRARPSPRARLDLVRAVRDAGLAVRRHGGTGAAVAHRLRRAPGRGAVASRRGGRERRDGVRRCTCGPVRASGSSAGSERERPDLVPAYRRLYARGPQASADYRRWLADRVAPILRRHGLGVWAWACGVSRRGADPRCGGRHRSGSSSLCPEGVRAAAGRSPEGVRRPVAPAPGFRHGKTEGGGSSWGC